MTRVHRLLLGLGALQLADLLSTYMALALGAHEGNPLMAPIVNTPIEAMGVKLVVILLVAALALRSPAEVARRWLAIAILLYCFVVVNNLIVVGRYA